MIKEFMPHPDDISVAYNEAKLREPIDGQQVQGESEIGKREVGVVGVGIRINGSAKVFTTKRDL